MGREEMGKEDEEHPQEDNGSHNSFQFIFYNVIYMLTGVQFVVVLVVAPCSCFKLQPKAFLLPIFSPLPLTLNIVVACHACSVGICICTMCVYANDLATGSHNNQQTADQVCVCVYVCCSCSCTVCILPNQKFAHKVSLTAKFSLVKVARTMRHSTMPPIPVPFHTTHNACGFCCNALQINLTWSTSKNNNKNNSCTNNQSNWHDSIKSNRQETAKKHSNWADYAPLIFRMPQRLCC